jgi:hypothetical protein
MKKPVVRAVKKPVSRATLLEELLSEFLELEDMLLKIELKNALQPLTARQRRLYNQAHYSVHALVRDLTNDVAQEHGAA